MPDLQDRLATALAGRYSIDRRLGAGGMAVVFLAEDTRHRRQVAIKVMKPEMALAIGTERFLREIKIAAGLHHPHILPIHDSGNADDLLYFVMPFADGPTLRSRLNKDPQLPLDEVSRVTREVADALQFAHERGIVHRDIKPENILFQAGHAMVADFGVARATADANLTWTGASVGTPAYMSPEQASGRADARSDIYSLGCVLYEMLTGRPPFQGRSMQETVARHSIDPVPSVRAARHSVPDALERLVIRALAKQPVDRFQTARELAEALDAAERSPAAVTTSVEPSRESPRPVATEASIAVLPFALLSPEPSQEYLGDGIAEEVMSALARLPGLRVVARTSAFAFKGRNEDVRTIGQRLSVRSILEGSVRVAGNRVKVTARLVNAADGYELWSSEYDRQLDDVFAIQDEIGKSIAEALEVQLVRGGTRHSTRDPQAYQEYLKGRYHWNSRTRAGIRKAIEHFQRALDHDAGYAAAYAGLADAHVINGVYGWEAPGDVMPEAKKAAGRALEIDGASPEALTSLACVRAIHDWDWVAAEQDFARAIERGPSYSTAFHWYAINCLVPLGRFAEADKQLRRASELDPLSLPIKATRGMLHYYAHEFDLAAATFEQTLEIEPVFGFALHFLGQTRIAQGRHDEAVRTLRKAVKSSGDSAETVAALAHGLAVSHKHREAKALLASLNKRAERGYVSPSLIAQVHVGLGNHAEALDLLEKACATRACDLAWLGVRPVFDLLRGEPRFKDVTKRLGL